MGAPKGKGKGKGKAPGTKGSGKGKGNSKGSKGAKGSADQGKGKGKWMKVKPTVLVTGASGYVATNVIRRLESKGYKVRGTVRSLEDHSKVGPLKRLFPTLELVEADLLKGEAAFEEAMKGCTYVMHCASPFKLNVNDPVKELVEPAVKGTEAVMKAAAKAKVSKVVITSSVAAVGPSVAWFKDVDGKDKDKVFTEEDWNTDDKPTDGISGYRASKTQAEQRAWDLSKELGVTISVVCPSFVIGPMMHSRSDGESVSFMQDLLNGNMKAKADEGKLAANRLCYVDVRDISAAHVAAMEKDAADGKRFICASETSYSRLEAADMLRDRFKAYALPTKSQEGTHGPKYNTSRAKEVLGFRPKPVDVSLKDMANAALRLGLVDRKFVTKAAKFGKVSDIVPDSKGINILVKVVSKGDLVEEGRDAKKMQEVVVGDETGVVTLKLTEDEAKALAVDKVVSVQNAVVRMPKGFIRVYVGKWGKIAPHDGDADPKPNKAKDVSAAEYELVKS